MERIFQTGVTISHLIMKQIIKASDLVIDATCGNGYDTIFLAELVGNSGHVYGFDIQEQALANTSAKLHAAGFGTRATLIHAGHELMKRYVLSPVKAIIFNLGYLPGGDHQLVTNQETTLMALKEGLELLQPAGAIVIVMYPGHFGGADETRAIINFANSLSKKDLDIIGINHLNRGDRAPQVLVLQKIK